MPKSNVTNTVSHVTCSGFNVVYDVKYRLIERTDEIIKTQLNKNIIIISSLNFCFIYSFIQ